MLLTDLKQRGLLDTTLVVWGGEFGWLPNHQGSEGSDYNSVGFTVWLARGGVMGALAYGSYRLILLCGCGEQGARPRPSSHHSPPARDQP